MVDFFDKLYSSIISKNVFFDKIRFYSLLRFLTREIANMILPLYFRLTANNSRYALNNTEKTNGRLVVSLTSFPARIDRLWLVIETLLRQTYKPDMVILWLSKEQFPQLETLPASLLNLQKRGLQIELREGDLRSHKKYYYTLESYPNDIMVTVDDDVFYNSHLLAYLVESATAFPDTICCTNSKIITFDHNELLPYNQWDIKRKYLIPTYDTIAIGIGGVLYPIGALNGNVLDKDAFMNYCPNADDIWLKAMSLINHRKSIQTTYKSAYLPVLSKKNETLCLTNLQGGNDNQIQAIRAYLLEKFGQDPFGRLN